MRASSLLSSFPTSLAQSTSQACAVAAASGRDMAMFAGSTASLAADWLGRLQRVAEHDFVFLWGDLEGRGEAAGQQQRQGVGSSSGEGTASCWPLGCLVAMFQNMASELSSDSTSGVLSLRMTVLLLCCCCTALCFAVTARLIASHLTSYTKPTEQKWIIACIFMLPLFSLSALLSLWDASLDPCFSFLCDCYEAAAIYSFSAYLIACMGGEQRAVLKLAGQYHSTNPTSSSSSSSSPSSLPSSSPSSPVTPTHIHRASSLPLFPHSHPPSAHPPRSHPLRTKHPKSVSLLSPADCPPPSRRLPSSPAPHAASPLLTPLLPPHSSLSPHSVDQQGLLRLLHPPSLFSPHHTHHHPFPFSLLLPPWAHGKQLYDGCKFGIVQYMVVKSACGLLLLSLDCLHLSSDRAFDWATVNPYVTLAVNFSQSYALYCVLLFYHASHHFLSHIRPLLPKFLLIKAVIFVTWWQSVAIAALCSLHLLPLPAAPITEGALFQRSLQHILICIEMAIAALVSLSVFPSLPYHPSSSSLRPDHVAVMANMANPWSELDPEEVVASETSSVPLHYPLRSPPVRDVGLDIAQNLADVVWGGSGHVAGDVREVVNVAAAPFEKSVRRLDSRMAKTTANLMQSIGSGRQGRKAKVMSRDANKNLFQSRMASGSRFLESVRTPLLPGNLNELG